MKRRLFLTRLGQIAAGLGLGGYAAAHSQPGAAKPMASDVFPLPPDPLVRKPRGEYQRVYLEDFPATVVRFEDYLIHLKHSPPGLN